MSKLLLVEDDLELTECLVQQFKDTSWSVEVANTIADAEQFLSSMSFDLIILDWDLPDGSGLTLMKKLRRQHCQIQIIFLTGKTSIDDKEMGLDSGADDYITKPFDMRELFAKIRSVQRRPRHILIDRLVQHAVELDERTRTLIFDKQSLSLSPTETLICEFFFRHPDRLINSADLFSQIWPLDSDYKQDTVRVHLHSLRRKLKLAKFPDLIETVKGSGYILRSVP